MNPSDFHPRRAARAMRIASLAAALLLAGCATAPDRHPLDPFEPFNRGMMRFNEGVDRAVLKPVATAYRDNVPAPVRTGVSNFFGNLGDLWSGINSALQLKIPNAMENFMRFGVNTFFGLGGLIDIASEAGIERHREDFGQTLGRWGVPSGPYLMLPFLGPSTLRDTLVIPIDRKGDPVHYVNSEELRYTLYGTRVVDTRANLLLVGDVLSDAALDRYTFTRDAYLQKRRAEVQESRRPDPNAGQTPQVDEPARQPGGQPADTQRR